MYEDSQRFSEEEGDESSHVISFHPRSTMADGPHYRRDEFELRNPGANAMQRGADGDMSPSFVGVDHTIETPTYDDLHTNIREESIQRILSRLSPNGQRAFLRTLSEGEGDVIAPTPFSVPETDEEDEHSEMERGEGDQSEINYLLDSPIPDLTTKSLIPPPEGGIIQSRSLIREHPNVTVHVTRMDTTVYTERTGVGGRLGDEQPHHSHVNKPAEEHFCDYVPPSRQGIRPKPYLPSEVERARVTKNLFPETSARERNRNIIPTDYAKAYEAESKDSCARTTGSTHVVWTGRDIRPSNDETTTFRPIPSTRVVGSSATYPKLLAGVEIFGSVRSPLSVDQDMLYVERTGAGYSTTSPGGTVKYQYFEPLETRTHKERNVTQLKGGGLGDGHSVVPLQEHIDPLGGGKPRYITRPGPQIFSGSDGDMLGIYEGRIARPVPTERLRGKPLDNMRPPRPPH
jgi:hypothetical protein